MMLFFCFDLTEVCDVGNISTKIFKGTGKVI